MTWGIWSILSQPVKSLKITFRWALFVQSIQGLNCYMINFIVHISSHFLQSALHCSCFISFPSVHTSLIMFHFYFLQSIVYLIHIYFFDCTHITCSFNVTINFTFQPIPPLEINDLWVSLDNFLILDSYSLLDAELRWIYFSLPLYITQEIQYDLQKYRGFVFHDTEQWCKIWINTDLLVSKMPWGIGWTFIRALKSLKNYTLMGSFCPKHMFQLEKFIGIMCHYLKGWCKI